MTFCEPICSVNSTKIDAGNRWTATLFKQHYDPLVRLITEFITKVALGAFSMDQPLQVYFEEFETIYLQETQTFYRREAKRLLDSMDINAFIQTAASLLRKEQERCLRYCDDSSRDRVRPFDALR
jgi:hypothetical protein